MAVNQIKTNYSNRSSTDEYVVDKVEEVDFLPTTEHGGTGDFKFLKNHATLGSTCIVGNEDGEVIVYMLFSFGWKAINSK